MIAKPEPCSEKAWLYYHICGQVIARSAAIEKEIVDKILRYKPKVKNNDASRNKLTTYDELLDTTFANKVEELKDVVKYITNGKDKKYSTLFEELDDIRCWRNVFAHGIRECTPRDLKKLKGDEIYVRGRLKDCNKSKNNTKTIGVTKVSLGEHYSRMEKWWETYKKLVGLHK